MEAPAVRPEDRPRGPVGAPGMVLGGKYRLEEAIARGGMARVWRARHIELNRPVAVKFVEGAGEGKTGIERFLVEAKVAASVRHKNVVDILDFGFVELPDRDPEPYMVMELLEGETLADRMVRSPLSDDEVVDIALQLLSGLDAVHRAGIIHRDLKPGNLFLTHDHDGTFARLLDFGISQPQELGAIGDGNLVVGTPEYMSPEQAFGAAIDLRSDLYGVGILLYEMLSRGRLPFENDDAQRVLEMVVAGHHELLVSIRPDQPELCAVVERAIARNPEDRFANARDMRRALVDASGGGDTTTERMAAIRESGTRKRQQAITAPELVAASRPPETPSVPTPAARRTPVTAIVVGITVLGIAIGAWMMSSSSAPAVAPVAAAPTTPERATTPIAPAPVVIATPEAPSAPTIVLGASPEVAEGVLTTSEGEAEDDEDGATARRRRPGTRRPVAEEAPAAVEAPSETAPAGPPRTVVRDLDF